jgi:hypothetical protein
MPSQCKTLNHLAKFRHSIQALDIKIYCKTKRGKLPPKEKEHKKAIHSFEKLASLNMVTPIRHSYIQAHIQRATEAN